MATLKALKLRTDCLSDSVNAKVVAWVQKFSPAHCVVQHNADKECDAPHWHAILWTQRDAQSARVALLKAIPELKNKYSLTSAGEILEHYEAYERYMCHGDCDGDRVIIITAQPAVHHAAGVYTQAWAQEQNKRFYQVQREFVRKCKDKKLPVIEKVVEASRACGARTPESVGKILVELYTREHKMMNVYNMRAQLRTALCILNGSKCQRTVLAEVLQGMVEPQENFYVNDTDTRTQEPDILDQESS